MESLEPRICLSAMFFTEQASIDVRGLIPPTPPPISSVLEAGELQGRQFQNTTGFDADGNLRLRTVGAIPISSLKTTSGSIQAIVGPGGESQLLVMAYGIEGFVESTVGGQAIAQFTTGEFGVFRVSSRIFNANDPATWDDPDGVGTRFNDPVASWVLKPPEPVVPGAGEPLNFAANEVNRSGANVAVGVQSQGVLLFRELVDPGPGFTGATTQAEFVIVTTNSTGFPSEDG